MSKIQLADLGPIIECLEDNSFNSSVLLSKNYSDIINGLQDAPKVDVTMAERLINICLRGFSENLQYTSSNMMIISLILKKIKEGRCEDSHKLSKLFENTALAIIELLKKTLKKSLLRKMAVDTLLLHPDEALRFVVINHMQEVVDLVDYNTKTEFQCEITAQIVSIVARILAILPSAEKLEFVKCGLKAWFNSIIPGVLSMAVRDEPDLLQQNIAVLEVLVENLVTINYAELNSWQNLLLSICSANKYPAILKKLIETKCNCWHRLWMIFIKLLKDQITKISSGVSPINALLPVVEWAFKLDSENRCRAFECWNVLIDNFATELNEALITKRLKLLIIPLKLNNAKKPEIVLVKFNTWWHLIRRFESKIDKHTDAVLIPFMHFCFGKPPLLVSTPPGLMTIDLAKKCVEAFVEIVGHVDCKGCVTLPQLKGRIISTKILVDHWADWVYCLSVAIKASSQHCCEPSMQRLRCLWKGFVLTVAELPANQIRADLFIELLKLVETLTRQTVNGDIIFNILICSLFENDDRIKQLLKTKGEEGPLHVVIRILNSNDMNFYYKGLKPEEAIAKLKPIMTLFMDPSYTHPDEIVKIWMNGFYDTKLFLWAALAEAICETKHELMPNILQEFVVWPFNIPATAESIKISESEAVWYKWFTLYSYVHPKKSAKFDETIISLMHPDGNFSLLAPIALLKQQLCLAQEERIGNLDYQADSLLKTLEGVEDFKRLEQYLPILIDTLVLLLGNAIKPSNFNLMQTAVSTVTILLKHINGALRQEDTEIDLTLLEHLMKPIATILQSEKCLAKVLMTPLVDELCSCALNTSKYSTLQKELIKILTLTLSIYHRGSYMSNKVTNTIKTIKKDESTSSRIIGNETHVNSNTDSFQVNKTLEREVITEKDQEKNSLDQNKEHQNTTEAPQITGQEQYKNKNDFTTPPKKSVKKSKTKEPNIVNTVVENGEEFAVVQSHWKFNPKKLTENQKEKLKRKREDIPALYQDLSQSQDEIKLKTWKTDSQDATTTTSSKSESNSKTNEDVNYILKNIPSTDVVPKIIENIFPDSTNKNLSKEVEKPVDKKIPVLKTPSGKEPKTPRLALKDRVFRNVRNLMEKSGTQSACKIVIEDMNETLNENSLKTPVTKKKSEANTINSAPPVLERPLRVIKKPKKFEDSALFDLKKRRRSQGGSNSDSSPPNEEETEEVISDKLAPNDGDNMSKSHENPELPPKESQVDEFITESVTHVENNNEVSSQIVSSQKHENDDQKKHENIYQSKETPTAHMAVVEQPVHNQTVLEIKDTPVEQVINNQNHNTSQLIEEIPAPKTADKSKDNKQSTIKKKRSRIEKQLLIDMVEGHPILQQSQSEKRASRKNQMNEPNDSVSKRRKSLFEKSYKIKAELKSVGLIPKKKEKTSPKAANQKSNKMQLSQEQSQAITIIESQDSLPETSSTSEDQPMSEDVIESSQDSSITTISIKSSSSKKIVPIVSLDKENPLANKVSDTQKLLEEFNNDIMVLNDSINESKDDIELSKNKTAVSEDKDMTEDMDTEPMGSGEVILVNDEEPAPIVINTEDTVVGKETQEMAEADTLPIEIESLMPSTANQKANNEAKYTTIENSYTENDITHVPTQDDITPTISGTAEFINDIIQESSNTGSPSRDDIQRKKEFLNDTIEISPIKALSPIEENKSPSPETSNEYVVIKLTTPVQSNGEPFAEKCDSPEVFTEEKVSPDKRDQSPPRKEITNNHSSSPSSSLSLKKNRPQMRFNGRAAQMLELCVPNRPETEETVKRSSLASTPAKRNLRKAYCTDNTENQESNEDEENENFLKLSRALPTLGSPSVPILKRKLAEIADEYTISPVCKRKRVSFHDPPVSTTVAVQKYIEPCGLRSPSNSTRLERQTRAQTNAKSPKRLDNVFRLDTLENFSDENTVSNDTEISLDETPAVEIIKTSELNDKDPICSELIDCKDPIENIAGELSSPSTKALLIKELKGKVETIADLAKMSELEVNRLCIKAPKVKVAKKVLADYAAKRAKTQEMGNATAPTEALVRPPEVERVSMETQTNQVLTKSNEMQTEAITSSSVYVQTVAVATSHCSAQTNESGSKSTKDIVASCLSERPDFVDQITNQLDECAVTKISEKLSTDALLKLLMNRVVTTEDAHNLLSTILTPLCDRFDSKDSLLCFFIQLLQKVHDKPI